MGVRGSGGTVDSHAEVERWILEKFTTSSISVMVFDLLSYPTCPENDDGVGGGGTFQLNFYTTSFVKLLFFFNRTNNHPTT